MRRCTVEGCTRKHSANGLCHPHLMQQRRTGQVKPPTPPATHRTRVTPRRYV